MRSRLKDKIEFVLDEEECDDEIEVHCDGTASKTTKKDVTRKTSSSRRRNDKGRFGLSHWRSKVQDNHNMEFVSALEGCGDEIEVQYDEKPTTKQNMKDITRKTSWSRCRKAFFCLSCLLLVVVVGTPLVIMGVKKPLQTTTLGKNLQGKADRTCIDYEISDLNENYLELSLTGLTRPIAVAEQVVIERVVLDGYNEVSGKCRDIFKRWMVHTDMVNQTMVISDDELPQVVVMVKMDISCVECPEDQEFASIFPDNSRRTLSDDTTIDSSQIIDLIEAMLIDESNVESIEGTFTSVSDAYYTSSGSTGKTAVGKGKSNNAQGVEERDGTYGVGVGSITVSIDPTPSSTSAPTPTQTLSPTLVPTNNTTTLTNNPISSPNSSPTSAPTPIHTPGPTSGPTPGQTPSPTPGPTSGPTLPPTLGPTNTPTATLTREKISGPTQAPTSLPTSSPVAGTTPPTSGPTQGPTLEPTPGSTPTPTLDPPPGLAQGPLQGQTPGPTRESTPGPTPGPTTAPTPGPTLRPTPGPTLRPTLGMTRSPSPDPTSGPTSGPTRGPTPAPTPTPSSESTPGRTIDPTPSPTNAPTHEPTPYATAPPTPIGSKNGSESNNAEGNGTRPPTRSPTPRTTTHPTDEPTPSPTSSSNSKKKSKKDKRGRFLPTLSPTNY